MCQTLLDQLDCLALYLRMPTNRFRVLHGSALKELKQIPSKSVNCCITSPPYWNQRDYGVEGQFGLEPSLDEYIDRLAGVLREVNRILMDAGTLWLNLGDTYSSKNYRLQHGGALKQKDLAGVPWRVALALQADGWFLRSDIVWHKPNPVPESARDRPTRSHEYIFLMSKSVRYFYDSDSLREPYVSCKTRFKSQIWRRDRLRSAPRKRPVRHRGGLRNILGRNKRTVWTVASTGYRGCHNATFPEKLIEPCILAGCPKGGTVLDPFAGTGTTLVVALKHGRNALGIDLNPKYCSIARERCMAASRLH